MTVDEIRAADAAGARFTVDGWGGVAFYFRTTEQRDEYDEETGENVTAWSGYQIPTGRVLMVMVGDDQDHSVDPDDVTALGEFDYCVECGQVGCTADGRSRE